MGFISMFILNMACPFCLLPSCLFAAFQLHLSMNRLRLDTQQTRSNSRHAAYTYVPYLL